MSIDLNREKLKALANELAKDIKTEKDLNALSAELLKMTVEAALDAEMEDHLGYAKHDVKGRGSGNSRNGISRKRLKGDHGEIEIETPRDRNASFEPQFIHKGQTRLTRTDDQILFLYAKGLTTREIVETIQEMFGAEVSASLISEVTNQVIEWQNRPLDALYPVVYLDCIVLKIRQDKRVINKSLYLTLGINIQGHKELLGMWLAQTEGAKFWLSVLSELKTRGLNDILIACVDGLKVFPDAIAAEYPDTRVQLCIVHMIRNSLKLVAWKDYRAVTQGLKEIDQSVCETEASAALDDFARTWDSKYPQFSKSWRHHWDNLIALFDYPPQIRKAIYTTNAIESLNSVIRKATKKRKLFPTDDAALKVVYLAVNQASRKWTMPIQNWKLALNRFSIEFGDRVTDHL